MRVLAALLPMLAGDWPKLPCQRKKPITKAGKHQSNIVLQENFIFIGLLAKLLKLRLS
jgi:hypothetical protein